MLGAVTPGFHLLVTAPARKAGCADGRPQPTGLVAAVIAAAHDGR
jgi:hypothetical protein